MQKLRTHDIKREMNIFNRRIIQESLDSLEHVFSPDEHKDLVTRLNKKNGNSLATEWEIILLDQLQKLGRLQYERVLPSGEKIDITFEPEGNPAFPGFTAEITAISDKQAHEENPHDLFTHTFYRLGKKHGINTNHLSYKIEDRWEGVYGNRKRLLDLPPASEIVATLTRQMMPFFRYIRDQKPEKTGIKIDEDGCRYQIGYNIHQKNSGGHIPSYSVAYSLEDNTLWKALDRKRRKLKKDPGNLPKGIFVCDAGCDMLRSRMKGIESYSAEDIIGGFLHKYEDLDFVAIVTVDRVYTHGMMFPQMSSIKSYVRFLVRDKNLISVYEPLSDSLNKTLPAPAITPLNAGYKVRKKIKGGNSHGLYGAFIMNGNTVKISSSMLCDLLAGNISQEDFFRQMRFRKLGDPSNEGILNPFSRFSAEGRMIESMSVEKTDDDDDWITFKFGEPDVANIDFRIRRQT